MHDEEFKEESRAVVWVQYHAPEPMPDLSGILRQPPPSPWFDSTKGGRTRHPKRENLKNGQPRKRGRK